MSGGSHNYAFARIENDLCGQMEDAELNDLMLDIGKLAHDLEWWKSGDTSEATYRKTVKAFKAKWFEADRNKRIEKYVKEAFDKTKNAMLKMIGHYEGSYDEEDYPESDLDDWMEYTE